MTDENTTGDAATAELEPRTLTNPVTGKVLDLDQATIGELASEFDSLATIVADLAEHKRILVLELAGRLDRKNTRSAKVDGWALETNAPTVESYTVDGVRAALEDLVAHDVLDEDVIGTVITTPPPSTPEPRVDKRELNKLKGHDNPAVARALAAARTRSPQNRTMKVKAAKANG